MAFDFAARPPEINSALMYSGSGAGPLMAPRGPSAASADWAMGASDEFSASTPEPVRSPQQPVGAGDSLDRAGL
jgi:hypothetical protein